MHDKPIAASQYTLAEALGVCLAMCQRCMAEVRVLASRPMPMGETGPIGEAGPQGVQGPTGMTGERGERGLPGADARPWRHRRAYEPAQTYDEGDVVAHDGGSFVALQDKPGSLPGPGWASLTTRGQRGKPGDRGERGPQGPAGRGIVRIYSDETTRALVIEFSDGTQEAFAVETL